MLNLTAKTVARFLSSKRSPEACNRAIARLQKVIRLTPWTDYKRRLMVLQATLAEKRLVLIAINQTDFEQHLSRMAELAHSVWD